MIDFSSKERLFHFLSHHGYDLKKVELFPCLMGGNNTTIGFNYEDKTILAKIYYSDDKDRLGAEWAFLTYAITQGINCVPYPIEKDLDEKIALYEFIEGVRPLKGKITLSDVEQAAHFIKKLNAGKNKKDISLPLAADACFSIKDHLSIVDARISTLQSIDYRGDLALEFKDFMKELSFKWERLKPKIQDISKKHGIEMEEILDKNMWYISPSDFGFHNSILSKTGKLFFIDFEYAGWDDPAKMVADFFLQPAVSVSSEHLDYFMDEVFSTHQNPQTLKIRTHVLGSVFVIKWCCIILNCFIPDYLKRSLFSKPGKNVKLLQGERLTHAKEHLSNSFFFNYLFD